MKYFIPEWDDRIDQDYDFISDQYSSRHKRDPYSDHYMWEVFGLKDVPFDGVLVSKLKVEENMKKRIEISEIGIHKFLRLPQNFMIMGDCGAFGYMKEKVPPYHPIKILDYYRDNGFNIGVTVDHLVVPKFKEEKDQRMKITFTNGLKGYEVWVKKYRSDFELLVAVQGIDIDDYVTMFKDYYKHGVRNFAFGGLVRSPTKHICRLIDELREVIERHKMMPDRFHFFGLGRFQLFIKYAELEELGIQVSFDTASWLRRAWLSGVNYYDNYYTINDGLGGYRAIRIPQTARKRTGLRGKKKLGKDVDLDKLKKLENECLTKLRLYDLGKNTIEQAMDCIKELNKVLEWDNNLEKHYYRTLKDKPWKKCNCPICKSIGIEVIIFRGNNRNRRRGFHNTYLIYHDILKNPERWPLIEMKKEHKCKINKLHEGDLRSYIRQYINKIRNRELLHVLFLKFFPKSLDR